MKERRFKNKMQKYIPLLLSELFQNLSGMFWPRLNKTWNIFFRNALFSFIHIFLKICLNLRNKKIASKQEDKLLNRNLFWEENFEYLFVPYLATPFLTFLYFKPHFCHNRSFLTPVDCVPNYGLLALCFLQWPL